MTTSYDALLVLSFGGPEKMQDVIPFLENVTRGKKIPRHRLREVAQHYELFDGVSPINAQNRALITALETELAEHGPHLPIYFGNRNWHPLLTDTMRQMADDGVHRALVFVTSAFGSYSSCRQYLENIQSAQHQIDPGAPRFDKLRLFFNHPGFIEPMADNLTDALEQIPAQRRDAAAIIFTAHSIPSAMSATCPYQQQVTESCRLVAEKLAINDWTLVYQSRSGPPSQAWLEPDICDYLNSLHQSRSSRDVVIVPIGFLCDHIEVLYDLDTEAAQLCDELGVNMVRAATVATHRRFVTMIRQLIAERTKPTASRAALGQLQPAPDTCPPDCCPPAN